MKTSIIEHNKKLINRILALIVNEQAVRDSEYSDLLRRFTEVYKERGGIL